MIVSVEIGEDISVVLDDDMAGCYSATRLSEMCDQAADLVEDAVRACKAATSRTVKARQA